MPASRLSADHAWRIPGQDAALPPGLPGESDVGLLQDRRYCPSSDVRPKFVVISTRFVTALH
jgi:hypothetical protein